MGYRLGWRKSDARRVMTMCLKLARMRTMAWSLRREPHQQKGKDRARIQMPGMTRMTDPGPVVVVATSPSNHQGA